MEERIAEIEARLDLIEERQDILKRALKAVAHIFECMFKPDGQRESSATEED